MIPFQETGGPHSTVMNTTGVERRGHPHFSETLMLPPPQHGSVIASFGNCVYGFPISNFF